MGRKKTAAHWKHKAVVIAGLLAKRRAGGRCEWCGRLPNSAKGIQAAHIVPVEYEATAADPDNIMCLCFGCHKIKWHGHPLLAAAWFIEKHGMDHFARATQAERCKLSAKEWVVIHERLRQQCEEDT